MQPHYAQALDLRPDLTPQQLRDLLASQPEQALAVAVHPQADAPLRAWLWETGDGAMRLSMYQFYLAQRERIAALGQPLPGDAVRFDEAVARTYAQWQEGLVGAPHEDLTMTMTSTSGEHAPSPQVSPLAKPAAPAHAAGAEEGAEAAVPQVQLPAVQAPADGYGDAVDPAPIAWLSLPDGAQVALTAVTVLVGRNPEVLYPSAQLVTHVDERRLLSSTHALLRLHDGHWFINDLGSTNGTIVGRDPRTPALTPGQTEFLAGEFMLGGLPFTLTMLHPEGIL
ncbi:FHA domain-containing protein [Leucobacter sp. HY1908]